MGKANSFTRLSHWFTYPRIHLPIWAPSNPNRALFSKLTGDAYQQWAFDNGTMWQVTVSPIGVNRAFPTSDGLYAWFFSFLDEEQGVWVRQDIFETDNLEIPVLQPIGRLRGAVSSKGGLLSALCVQGETILSILSDGSNATVDPIHVLEGDWELRDANLEDLLAVLLSNENDHTAVLVDLSTGCSQYFEARKITDVALHVGSRGLLIATNQGTASLTVSDFSQNTKLVVDLPGSEVSITSLSAQYAILRVDLHGRSQLCRMSLDNGDLYWLDTPRGSIPDFTVTPNGDVCYLYSNMTTSPQVRVYRIQSYQDVRVDFIPAVDRQVEGSSEEIWVPGAEGDIHVFITKPHNPRSDHKQVFLIHGGPDWADFDEYSPVRAAWIDAGYTVVQVNYRGSLTYGTEWKEAIYERAGMVEVEDIMTVKAYLDNQQHNPSIIIGESWGGLVALLTTARFPQHWQAVIAHAPVADLIANYYEETLQLQEFDHLLFGGTPETARSAYLKSSPIELASSIRCPVMVISGENDDRCGPRQIESFVSKLRWVGGTVVHVNTSASHVLVDTDLRMQIMREQLDFSKNPSFYAMSNPPVKYL